MPFTIRTKLTFWYTSLLGFSLISAGIFLYIAAQQAMVTALDTKLLFLAETMARTVIKPHTQLILPQNFDVLMERFFGLKTSGSYIQITDRFGNVKSRSETLGKARLPLSGKAVQNALANKTTYETVDYVGRQPLRVITYPAMDNNTLDYIIQVAASMESVQSTLSDIVYIFYLTIPFVIILATAGGFVLASKALSPVHEITTAARRIGAENLHERIAVLGTGDEIDNLADTFNEMVGRLEISFKRMKQFTSDASHELRTPLTILKGETEVALKKCRSLEEMRGVLESNLEEINRMSRIVNNLLTLVKSDTDVKHEFQDVRLNEIIDEKFRQTKHIAEAKKVEMKLLKNEEVLVSGDPLRLRQLILNLLDNAVKFTHDHGNVIVSLERYNDNAVIKVSDTGIGIQEEDLPFIFDRFYRVDKGRSREDGGTGLGLSICKEIADAHGGRIEVDSVIGKGSTFKVYIPVKPA